jgi:hypothetical protein
MMDKKLAETLSNALGKDLVKWILVREEIEKYFKEKPIDDEALTLDLNPHLFLIEAIKDISNNVTKSGFTCSKEDVTLFWLTELFVEKSKKNLSKRKF